MCHFGLALQMKQRAAAMVIMCLNWHPIKAVLHSAFRPFVQKPLTLESQRYCWRCYAGSLIGIFQGIDTRCLYGQNKIGSRAIIPTVKQKGKDGWQKKSFKQTICHF